MSTTTEVSFTLQDVVDKVREVAAERPDFVYTVPDPLDEYNSGCFYRHGENREEPGCIVGQALDRLGYIVPESEEGNNSVQLLADVFGIAPLYTEPSQDWIRRVQLAQDEGSTWGEAVEQADSEVKL